MDLKSAKKIIDVLYKYNDNMLPAGNWLKDNGLHEFTNFIKTHKNDFVGLRQESFAFGKIIGHNVIIGHNRPDVFFKYEKNKTIRKYGQLNRDLQELPKSEYFDNVLKSIIKIFKNPEMSKSKKNFKRPKEVSIGWLINNYYRSLIEYIECYRLEFIGIIDDITVGHTYNIKTIGYRLITPNLNKKVYRKK